MTCVFSRQMKKSAAFSVDLDSASLPSDPTVRVRYTLTVPKTYKSVERTDAVEITSSRSSWERDDALAALRRVLLLKAKDRPCGDALRTHITTLVLPWLDSEGDDFLKIVRALPFTLASPSAMPDPYSLITYPGDVVLRGSITVIPNGSFTFTQEFVFDLTRHEEQTVTLRNGHRLVWNPTSNSLSVVQDTVQ